MIKRPVRAVLLDVDGTLYSQRILRGFMGLELCTLPLSMHSYRSAYSIWRSLGYFRRVREELRHLGEPEDDLATLQYTEAAKRAGEDPAQIERVVAEWIYQRPLKYLRFCKRRGLEAFLTFLENKGVQVGVFSDYPVFDKLQALGVSQRISLTLCATDSEINAFKPHPKGFLHACTLWGLSPEEVLYIGDRPEVDAVGAANAGMPCALLREQFRVRGYSKSSVNYVTFASFTGLQHAFTSDC